MSIGGSQIVSRLGCPDNEKLRDQVGKFDIPAATRPQAIKNEAAAGKSQMQDCIVITDEFELGLVERCLEGHIGRSGLLNIELC